MLNPYEEYQLVFTQDNPAYIHRGTYQLLIVNEKILSGSEA
jgi:hypothetical protein